MEVRLIREEIKLRARWRKAAKARFLNALWINGSGRFASVSWCHGEPMVQIYIGRRQAEAAKALIDQYACGGGCCGANSHMIVDLEEVAKEYIGDLETVEGTLSADYMKKQ